MTEQTARGDGLDGSIGRLDRALGQLELRIEALTGQVAASNEDLFDRDRASLAAELDVCRGRARDLAAAGAEASQALGRAIAEVRAVLGEDVVAGAGT